MSGSTSASLARVVAGSGLVDARTVGPDVMVADVVLDTRAVRPGALFCALRGLHVDGHDLAASAVAAGADALCVERELDVAVTQIVVPDTRRAAAHLAASFWGHPSRHLTIVGVTGTNGKTTVTHLVAHVLETHGWPARVLGTLTGRFTTPEAPELQRTLASWRAEGARAVAMEVSSHALALHRADATRFAAAVFTNLSPEHLDFHGSMDAYFAAKGRLFERGRAELAVVNVDDPYGRRLAAQVEVPAVTYAIADAVGLELAARTRFRWREVPFDVPLQGRFNVANALAAIVTCTELGVPARAVAAALADVPAVPGRMEAVPVPGDRFRVFVDYAHTPDGLEVVLGTARELAGSAQVLVVFGCGGDRDRAKRPLMGEVAGRAADVAILTSDNPRSEDPAAIISAVRAGMSGATATVVEQADRRAAIGEALARASDGDVVVIAGKGHEATQTIGSRVVPFRDAAVVAELLAGASS
jgi:UDP-N-acetylmuramoyl-L-alanyl-D-glutamate--2,6-diaminopimelate ligase